MKDFSGFIEQLNVDVYNSIIDSASRSEDVKHNMQAQAFFIALNLLEHYHHWLETDEEQT